MSEDDDDALPCSLCGDEWGGYCSANVGGVDEHGNDMLVHVDACRRCSGRVLAAILDKAPDGAQLTLRKRRGKLLLVWERPPLYQQAIDVAAQAQGLVGERLRRALARWHKGRVGHG